MGKRGAEASQERRLERSSWELGKPKLEITGDTRGEAETVNSSSHGLGQPRMRWGEGKTELLG